MGAVMNRKRPARPHAATGLVVAASLTGLLAGCTDADPVPTERADIAGNVPIGTDGFPPFDSPDSRTAVVVEDRGCLAIETDAGERLWVVWPAQSIYGPEGDTIVLPQGMPVGDGDAVATIGWITTRSSLPDGDQHDSMWGQSAAFCLGADEQESELIIASTVTLES